MVDPTLTERSADRRRIALIETTHWHAPLYFSALERADLSVVGVCDSAGLSGKRVAERFGCAAYPDIDALLHTEAIDFAFVFGRHCDMPGLARRLIARRIPFAIEKPCGIKAIDVAALADEAEAAGVSVAVPFIFRLSDLLKLLETQERPGPVDHASFRFMAGPPGRYPAAGAPWALDRTLAGGGPLINVGVHFIDLFCHLVGEPVVSVSASATSHIHRLSIEDVISVRLQTRSGRIGTIECGYTFPSDANMQREFTFALRTEDAYFLSHPDGVLLRRRGRNGVLATDVVPVRHETDLYYPEFVDRALIDAFSGAPAVAGLREAERALRIVEASYRSAESGGAPMAVEP